MSGHYILNLSEEEFNERLERFDDLNLEEKLRLLIDRDLISKTELASSASLIPLVLKFKHENSAAVWTIILSIVSNLKIFFDFESKEEKKYKAFILDLVKEKLDEVGLVTRKGDDENMLRLRSILMALDYYADDEEDIRKLAKMFDDDYAKLDAEIRNDILDATIWLKPEMAEKFVADYQKIANPEIKFDLLFATTLARDEETLEKMMDYLKKPEVVKPQDHFHLFIYGYNNEKRSNFLKELEKEYPLFLYLFRNPRVKAKVFNWMEENWDYVRKISGDKSLDDYPRYTAASIRTEEEFEKYCKFFEPKENDPALARAIMIGKNEILARLALIKKDREESKKKYTKSSVAM